MQNTITTQQLQLACIGCLLSGATLFEHTFANFGILTEDAILTLPTQQDLAEDSDSDDETLTLEILASNLATDIDDASQPGELPLTNFELTYQVLSSVHSK